MTRTIFLLCRFTRNSYFFLIGGNQRELARQKNAKKQSGKSKGVGQSEGNKGQSLEARKLR